MKKNKDLKNKHLSDRTPAAGNAEDRRHSDRSGMTSSESGISGNKNPVANRQEDYQKADQQSDLSYGRNSGRQSDQRGETAE